MIQTHFIGRVEHNLADLREALELLAQVEAKIHAYLAPEGGDPEDPSYKGQLESARLIAEDIQRCNEVVLALATSLAPHR